MWITIAPFVTAHSKPIAHSYAGAGLLAHVVTGKYADHLPLYRQSEIYRSQDVELTPLLNCWSRCMTSCASMC
ncbi:hypothetical protein BZL70_27960 [Escherichia coli]|nr:hypothetical protein BZL68_24705 [Escherichia coli]OUK85921.1 hypothetical protein BZL70_27960 [Escherichia coli]